MARLRRAGCGRPVRLPPAPRGMRLGLMGGSFDPPHAGHRHAALVALRRLALHRVWWLVSPGNPLKARAPAPLAARLAAARAVAAHPRIVVTGAEAGLGARYTADTLAALRRRLPGVRLAWVMGADNLAGFHRWRRWREIAGAVAIAVVDRPGAGPRALAARAPRALAAARWPEAAARGLPGARPPAWALLRGPTSPASSTALRAAVEGSRPRGAASSTGATGPAAS